MKTIQSSQQIQPTNSANVVEVTLKEQARDGGGYPMMNWIPIRRVPNDDRGIDLQGGEQVLVMATEQIDNESSGEAGDQWREWVVREVKQGKAGSIQQQKKPPYRVTKVPNYWIEQRREAIKVDPRWTLPVMVELGVWRTASPTSIESSKNVVTNRGFNLDNSTHHGPWEGFRWDLVTANLTGVYYVTCVRFAWSEQFFYPGAKMEVLDRGTLSVTRWV